jgi:hypothetical protein
MQDSTGRKIITSKPTKNKHWYFRVYAKSSMCGAQSTWSRCFVLLRLRVAAVEKNNNYRAKGWHGN